MLTFVLAIIVAATIYYVLFKPLSYWKEKGIEYLKPLPFFGNMAPNTFLQRPFANMLEDMYYVYPTKRYVGIHQFLQPTLLIRDPDLIKKITVKDFDVFPDHRAFAASEDDTLGAKNLFSLLSTKGWHDMRSTLSPAFTSSKMRMMFGLMEESVDQFTNYYQKKGGTVTVELKEAYSRFATDVIGTTAFGVVCNSLEEPENQFYMMGKSLNSVSLIQNLKFFATSISPALMKLLGVHIFGREASDFFKGLVKETIRVREEKNIVRPDMIHLLLEARKGRLNFEGQDNVADSGFAAVEESEVGKTQKRQKADLSDDDITAQVFIFFFAGFDTISTAMSYATYELAVNPETQEKLYEEIREALEHGNGKITYEALLGMKYLDCVISETLRKWPPAVFMDRVSVKPFTIEPEQPGEKPLHLEKGSMIWIPAYAIQRDPSYYPNPDKFDPERFSEENKRNIKPFTYLPFGSGPRNCIGSRFALLEAKLLIVHLLQKFEFVPVTRTQVPIQLSKKNFNILPDDGIWVGFKPRNAS